jgi:hypothetical protein
MKKVKGVRLYLYLVLAIIILFGFVKLNFAQYDDSPAESPEFHSQPKATPSSSKMAQVKAQVNSSSSGSSATYVGVEKCKSCHPQEYEDFSQRRFNKAWKILKMREEEKNPECLRCHVTGYGKKGGFVNEEKTPHLTSKQCEACHGPGSEHVNNPADSQIRRNLKVVHKKNVCIQCHLCMKTHRTIEF